VTIAVVFVPAAHIAPYAKQCLDYCAARGYDIAGVVRDDWTAAVAMMANHSASVIVVARREHLDPHREPRLEILAEALEETRMPNARFRRPQLIQNRQPGYGAGPRRLGNGDVQLRRGDPRVAE
jgi:hypothetical protein